MKKFALVALALLCGCDGDKNVQRVAYSDHAVISRHKVNGGWLYVATSTNGLSLCFVSDDKAEKEEK